MPKHNPRSPKCHLQLRSRKHVHLLGDPASFALIICCALRVCLGSPRLPQRVTVSECEEEGTKLKYIGLQLKHVCSIMSRRKASKTICPFLAANTLHAPKGIRHHHDIHQCFIHLR